MVAMEKAARQRKPFFFKDKTMCMACTSKHTAFQAALHAFVMPLIVAKMFERTGP